VPSLLSHIISSYVSDKFIALIVRRLSQRWEMLGNFPRIPEYFTRLTVVQHLETRVASNALPRQQRSSDDIAGNERRLGSKRFCRNARLRLRIKEIRNSRSRARSRDDVSMYCTRYRDQR
jgi:hypothetical protein